MWSVRTLATVLGLFYGSAVYASDLTVQIKDTDGALVADAVVAVRPHDGGTVPVKGSSPKKAETKTIDQKNETFLPYVEIFRPGDQALFRNSDHVMHHVYSFSPVKSFEFPIASGASAPLILLDQPGIAAVGCNIHDHMIAYLFVTEAPWVAKTGVDGTAHLSGLPAGTYVVTVWHPQLHPARPDIEDTVTVDGDNPAQPMTFALSLLPDPRGEGGHDQRHY